MLTKYESSPIRKSKITPLFLLSKVKKNNDISFSRQSALSYIQKQQKKINNRYGEIMRKSSFRTDLGSTQLGRRNEKEGLIGLINNNVNKQSTAHKIEQLLKGSSKKGRFFTVQKRTRTDTSPYLSHERKRVLTEETIKQDPTTTLKVKIQKQRKLSQIRLDDEKQKNQDEMINKKLQNSQKVFIHFANLCKIDSIMENKRVQKQIIACIKKYILQDQGDPSELQTLYKSEKSCEIVKQILFLEKILIILIVDLIINKKYRLAELFLKSAVKIMISFYIKVYRDMYEAGKINSEDLIDIQLQALKKVIQAERSSDRTSGTLIYILQSLKSKVKSCFKYARHIQDYYKIHHKNIHSLTSNLAYYRLLQFYSLSLLGSNWLSWNIQFLEVCPSPYLHEEPKKKYTLVLDLDQTLIHYRLSPNNSFQGEFLIRPHMFQFLQNLAEYFQLGIFTCSMPQYADLIINHMKNISFRLYRHHTVRINGQYVKDLSRIGRDLKTLIMVDNLQPNFRLQKQNGIHIKSWYGDKTDQMLKLIQTQLIKLIQQNPDDIRKIKFGRKFL